MSNSRVLKLIQDKNTLQQATSNKKTEVTETLNRGQF